MRTDSSLLTTLLASLSLVVMQVPPSAADQVRPAKNVIFLLSDGTGPEAWPLLRWVEGKPLAVDSILTGAIRTYGADSIITDSAPGATAYATAVKGSDKGIAVTPWHVTIDGTYSGAGYVPIATVIEGARLSGRATGVVATSSIQHATPAAFTAHWPDRGDYAEIAEQQVYQGIDVVLGGGSIYLLPKGVEGGERKDGEDLRTVIACQVPDAQCDGCGRYAYVTTATELAGVQSGRVWGAFAKDAMRYEIDRTRFAPDEPSLADMTAKALSLLSTSTKGAEKGLFLFVEGSQVDWAAHDNDPAGVVSDLGAFDDAVAVALEFAKRQPDTLVIAVADHGTGGLSIGTVEDERYSQTDDDSVTAPLRRVRTSAKGLNELLQGEASRERIKQVIAAEWGIYDLSECELDLLFAKVAIRAPTVPITTRLLSRRARLGWTTVNHTGADVFLFAYGPGRPTGLVENVAIGKHMAETMGFELENVTKRLFVDGQAAFGALGYETAVERASPANPVFVVTKGAARAEMPISKNILRLGGQLTELEGLVVLAPRTGRVYVPGQAVELVNQRLK